MTAEPIYEKSQLLAQLPNLSHGFFGRRGGVSIGIYASLNCGFGSNDDPTNVKNNRHIVANIIGVAESQLVNPYQVHSALAQFLDKPFVGESPKVDAVVTNVKGLALGILTADCAPILFADIAAGVIGAAHAGWQGALGGVIEATVDLMVKYGATPANIVAAIGPCIAQESYEVGAEYYDRFLEANTANAAFFAPSAAPNKYLFDLKAYCKMRLGKCGVTQIDVLPHDTCALEADYFSNRRRTKAGEPDYGRNISVVGLK